MHVVYLALEDGGSIGVLQQPAQIALKLQLKLKTKHT
jgi:hypothetical protein